MDRNKASLLTRDTLDKYNLKDWKVRLVPELGHNNFLGLCSYKDKTIFLNAHHVDMHLEYDVEQTIRHEVAHALCPGHNHNEVWRAKAIEIGCVSPAPCSSLGLPPHIIDAIRSGHSIEVEIEEEVIRRPKYTVTRIQDKCQFCGKVAKTISEIKIPNNDPFRPENVIIKLECGHTLVKSIPKGTPFQTLLADGDMECAHEFEKNECQKCGGKRPFEFQVEGMLFAEQAITMNSGAIIMDEMGLGKTPQSIGVLHFHPELLPVLVIVKSKIKFQWFKQWLRWTRDGIIPQIINSSSDFLIPGMKAYIVSFDMLVPKTRKTKSGKTITQGFDITKFDKVGIKTVIIDECQHISNPDSSRTQMVRRIAKGKKVIGLSGTPWKNRGSEFFSILNMVAPMKFSSYQGYKDRWVQTYWSGKYLKEGGIRNPEAFKEYIKDIAIRRQRNEVMKELPPINRMPLYVELEQLYQDSYDEKEGDFVKWYNDKIIGGESLDTMQLLAQMTKMRHVAGLAKMPATREFVANFIEETERSIVIGVHHKDVGEILSMDLQKDHPDIQILQLKAGGDSSPIVEKFNSKRSILIASTLAGGEGVDGLQHTCYDLIMHERQWNPANEEQFEGRLLRMGQKSSSLNGTYVMANDTIDTMFDAIVERKRLQFHAAMNKGEAPVWNTGDIVKELADMIVQNHRRKKGFTSKEKKEDLQNTLVEIANEVGLT